MQDKKPICDIQNSRSRDMWKSVGAHSSDIESEKTHVMSQKAHAKRGDGRESHDMTCGRHTDRESESENKHRTC